MTLVSMARQQRAGADTRDGAIAELVGQSRRLRVRPLPLSEWTSPRLEISCRMLAWLSPCRVKVILILSKSPRLSAIRSSVSGRAPANLYSLFIRVYLSAAVVSIRQQVDPLQMRERRGKRGDLADALVIVVDAGDHRHTQADGVPALGKRPQVGQDRTDRRRR